uniref:Uncharacterized protein n=1 Tax=Tanacetum cinerariifolium TaxID=118510 RepID=A0A6L2JDL7_TANCI|nr:hypothetical protein [Tanacetum cinerariifolium]
MIFQALKTWFKTFGVMLNSPMINMHFGAFHIGDINVEVMRKHRYGYLREIEVRRADNDLYTFKEGDFPRLRINGTESKSKNKGKVPIEMELVLEQTEQGTSYEFLVSAEGVKELKRKVKIKGEKKEALLTIRLKPMLGIKCSKAFPLLVMKIPLLVHCPTEVRELIRTRRVLDIVLFPPPAQVYSPSKKDMSWTGLPEFADDTITDYSRPSPSIESNTSDLQNSNSSFSEHGESSGSIMSKPIIKFVKAADCLKVTKTNNIKNARKSTVRYAEMYRNTTKSPKVRGNQRN